MADKSSPMLVWKADYILQCGIVEESQCRKKLNKSSETEKTVKESRLMRYRLRNREELSLLIANHKRVNQEKP